MPNWVRSNLTISGDRVELDKFINLARNENYYYEEKDPKHRETLLDFGKFIPRPAEEEDWYSWNCENWGTKWNAKHIDLDDDNDDFILYQFETAWGRISDQLFSKMKEKFPTLEFSFACEEEGHYFWSRTEADGDIHDYSYPSHDCPQIAQIAKDNYLSESDVGCDDALSWAVSNAIDDLVMNLMANEDDVEILENGKYRWLGRDISTYEHMEKEEENAS